MAKGSVFGNCKYNEGVTCETPILCAKCGWNPKIADARREKIREKNEKGELRSDEQKQTR